MRLLFSSQKRYFNSGENYGQRPVEKNTVKKGGELMRDTILRWQDAEVATACTMKDGQRDGWAAGKRLISPGGCECGRETNRSDDFHSESHVTFCCSPCSNTHHHRRLFASGRTSVVSAPGDNAGTKTLPPTTSKHSQSFLMCFESIERRETGQQRRGRLKGVPAIRSTYSDPGTKNRCGHVATSRTPVSAAPTPNQTMKYPHVLSAVP